MPGPTSTDANFESTFANLAFARLRDKAPTLLDYLVGFQLIDKNDDETRAVGVFGFKVGKDWVYAPVFFLNGELKGHELMYIQTQDAFVPMTEPWVNYILNRRPRVLGELENKSPSELAIRQPDFDIMARTPYIGSKYASAADTHSHSSICDMLKKKNPDMLPFMDVFAVGPRHEKFAKLDVTFTIPAALAKLGKQAAVNLMATMQKDHEFAEAVLQFYPVESLVNYKQAAAQMSKETAGYMENASYAKCKDCEEFSGTANCKIVEGSVSPEGHCDHFHPNKVDTIQPIETLPGLKTAELDSIAEKQRKGEFTIPKPVVVLRGDDGSNVADDLSEDEKSQLVRNQYVVKDPREDSQKSKLYKTQIAATMNSPFKTGVYELYTPTGATKKALILVSPMILGWGCSRYPAMVVAIDLEGKRYGNFRNDDLLTTQWYGQDEFNKVYDSAVKPESVKLDDQVVLISETGNSTGTFTVNQKFNQSDGRLELKIYGHNSPAASSGLRKDERHLCPSTGLYDDDINSIVFTDREGDRITRVGSAIFVPKSYKALVLKSASKKKGGLNAVCSPIEMCSDADFGIGNWNDMIYNLKKTASSNPGIVSLQLRTDGIRFTPVINGEHGPRLSKTAAIKYLIEGQGLGKEDAELLVKDASPRKAETFWVKYAFGTPPASATFPEQQYGNEFGIPVKTTYPLEQTENLGREDYASNRDMYRNERYVDSDVKSYANTASNMGQKEVLDTAVISGLVKTMDSDSIVDGYISDLLLGLDRLGRILFMYYWHNEKFKERYGQQDMAELEDNLRNVFKNLGELTIFLKQKTVESDPSMTSEVQLTDVIG